MRGEALAAGGDAPALPLSMRVARLDWDRIGSELDAQGFAMTGPLLTAAECAGLQALYDEAAAFRSHVVMARHGFGQGDYKYFAYPLPPAIAALRSALYARLVSVANRWSRALGYETYYPATHEAFLASCRAAGQERPTPLLLRYGPGDHNCLHQDLYGALAFPLQAAILLSEPGRDFTGGEFVLVEQRPRQQSRAEVVPLERGEAVIFAVHHRPAQGARGAYRVTMRHGVSRVRGGTRFTAGIIFHDAS